jgi:hypothetical protein
VKALKQPAPFARALVAIAFGILSIQCTHPRACADPPAAIASWSSGMNLRHADDRAKLEAYLDKHPSSVNARYGASCSTPLHLAARLGRDDLAETLLTRSASRAALDSVSPNTRIDTFPDSILAANFAFRPAECFEGEPGDKADVRVSFASRTSTTEPPAT